MKRLAFFVILSFWLLWFSCDRVEGYPDSYNEGDIDEIYLYKDFNR